VACIQAWGARGEGVVQLCTFEVATLPLALHVQESCSGVAQRPTGAHEETEEQRPAPGSTTNLAIGAGDCHRGGRRGLGRHPLSG
jgi:hypothetical protein